MKNSDESGVRFHSVEDVARDAAARRYPTPKDGSADALLLAEAWQSWAKSTLLVQLNGYVHDRKVTVFIGNKAVTGPYEAFSVQKDQWLVDGAGRDLLRRLFDDDPATVWPTFSISPRPEAVSPLLRLLPSDTRILVRETWFRQFEATSTPADAIEAIEDTMRRQSNGWFRIIEVAALLEDAGRGKVSDWCKKLTTAAESGSLPMHEPESLERVVYDAVPPSRESRRARDFYELVHVDDLNTWLAANEPRLPYRLPGASVPPASAVGPALLSPLSNGLWLIAEAAASLSRQQQFSVEGQRNLAQRMGDCARLPADASLNLRSRHLETAQPLRADEATGLAIGVFPSDVNDWLAACNVDYRWDVARSEATEQGQRASEPLQVPKAHTDTPAASLTTDEICEAFDKVGMTSLEWRTTITKNLPNWLTACRTMLGRTGANPVQARWDPLKIGIALATGASRKAGTVPVAKLDAAFKQSPLQKFARAWEGVRADHPAWGD